MHEMLRMKSHLFAVTVTSLAYSRYAADYNYASEFVILYEKGELGFYLPEHIVKIRQRKAQKFFSQPSNAAFYFTECENLERSYNAFYGSLENGYSAASNEELATLFTTLLHLQARCASLYQGTDEGATKNIENELISRLKAATPEWQSALQELAVGDSEDITREELDFYALKKLPKITEAQLEAHIRKHPWVSAKSFIMSDAITEFKKVVQTREPRKEQKPTLRFSYLLSDEKISRLAETLRNSATMRIKLRRVLGTKILGSPLYIEISRRMNVKPQELVYKYDGNDILTFLEEKQMPYTPDSRAYVWKNGRLTLVIGDEFTALKKQVTAIGENKGEVNGMSVYPGKATGVCRIILPDRIEAMKNLVFNEGDVLLTSMTIPNMLFLADKASAIVTDEGGITCHASIISRELKKPCIVGTRCATKVFKDGDKIEVDAENGTVKLIN
ncbi:MAG: PEP-utilizing enzyme [Candidatus Micrarchaeota archaeon]